MPCRYCLFFTKSGFSSYFYSQDLEKNEAPCSNGSECVAIRDIAGGPGYPLRQMAPSCLCILCLRREMKAKWVRHTVLEETVVSTRLCQRWESLVGKEGGYREDCCIGPSGTHVSTNGFLKESDQDANITRTPGLERVCFTGFRGCGFGLYLGLRRRHPKVAH